MLESVFGMYSTNVCVTEVCMQIRQSLVSWANIDGHMLLFIFLPPLLFADSMNLQWNLIRRCLAQCSLLAGPGVILGSILNGLFARYVLPYVRSLPPHSRDCQPRLPAAIASRACQP